MKKKILLTLAVFAAFAALTACEKSNVTTKQTTTEVITTKADDNVVVNNHDRGTIDNSLPKIELPEVIINKSNDGVEPTLDVSDESISLGDEDLVETNAGSGQSEKIGNERFLTATVNIGYDFEGWWLGDKLLSLQLQYKCSEGETGVEAKFSLKDEFKPFEFTSNEDSCIITGLKDGYSKDLVIPEGVTKIVNNAFFGSNVAIVSLPKSLEEIGNYAFANTNLCVLTIKNTNLTFGSNLATNTNLHAIYVPDKTESLTGLINSLDVDPDYLYSYNIGEEIGLVVIGDYLFYEEDQWYLYKYLGNDKEITLPSATTKIPNYRIDNYAFYDNDNIETVTFSDAVLNIGYDAFRDCDNLKEVVISDSVTYIGKETFYDCDYLTTVIIGENVEKIDEEAFKYCYSLKEIVIPDSVTYIGKNAFYNCYNLLKVTIGKNVETIDDYAFQYCYNLKYVYNYSDYLTIEKDSSDNGYVGYYASSIITNKNVQEDDDKKDFIWHIDEGVVIIDAYLGKDKNIVIPEFEYKDNDGKTQYYNIYLGGSLFKNNNIIETVTLNNYVTSIGYQAFYYCSNLKSISTLNVATISEEAFRDCKNLETASLPNVASIGPCAFYGCEILKTVSSPKLESISRYAFYDCYCLETIDVSLLTSVPEYAFAYCKELKEAILTNATSVDDRAFLECYELETAIMSEATSIAYYAFSKCYSLRNVSFPKATLIRMYAFENCYSIIQITIPTTMPSNGLEEKSFYCCINLAEVINCSTAFTLSATAVGPSYSYVTNYARHVINPSDTYSSIINYDTEKNIITYTDPYTSGNKGKVFAGVIDRSVKKVVIPSDIDTVMRGSLCGCYAIEDLEINKMVYHLGYYFGLEADYSQYYNNDSYYNANDTRVPSTLKVIRIGSSMDELPTKAFYNCKYIEDIYFNSGLYINTDAFYNTNIKNVYVDLTDWCNMEFTNNVSNPISSAKTSIYFKNGDTYESLDTIEVPSGITTIGDYQFNYLKMAKVVLPAGIESIGTRAFYNCINLKEINLPNTINSIGEFAFYNTKIKSIVIPENVTVIPNSAFGMCSNLISVTINGNITSIGDGAFYNCRLLYNINIPNSLQTIGSYVFYNCENLSRVLLKETSVTSFGEYLFAGCVNLEEITFPTGLSSIDNTTFDKCDKLTFTTYDNGCYFGPESNPYKWLIKARTPQIFECVVHEDCEKIYASAFSRCANLRKITIPASCTDFDGCLDGLKNLQYIEFPYTSSLAFGQAIFGVNNSNVTNKLKSIVINGGTTIPESAFEGLSSVTRITINANITTIGASAFKDLPDTDLVLPTTITSIGANAFENSGVTEFTVNSTSSSYVLGNYAFKNCAKLVSANLQKLNKTTYNYSVGTFYGCTALETVTLPSSGKCINSYMFYGCTSLVSITIPSSVDQINPFAFKNSGLTSISFPNTGTVKLKLFRGSFSNTKITTLTIPNNVLVQNGDDSISYSESPCGVFEGCLNLTTVAINYDMGNYNSTYGGKYAFVGCTNLDTASFLATSSTVAEYTFKNCTKLTNVNFANITTIRDYAFMNTGFESITFASGTTFRSNAFLNCKALEEITFGGSFSYSRDNSDNLVFDRCSSLTTVNLTTSVAIPIYMFKNCESLKTIDFSKVSSIGNYAFMNTGLESITLPSTITSIGMYAFKGCKKLTTLDLECAVSSYAIFNECTALKNVTLGAAVTSIASGLFYECSSLSEIEIPNTVTSIGSNALECCAFVELTIPASVTSIDYFAMNYNNYLKKVTFEGSITTGDHDILSYCPMLEEVVFNGNMTTIYQSMFENDAKLSKIILPSTVTTIGYGAFSGCSSLKSINIPEGVTTIYGEAFKDCKLFTTITLPTTLTEIKSDAFKGCYALAEVYNLSTDLTVTAGSDSNGMVAYYAKAIHTSSTDPSSIVTDTNGYVFLYDGAKGYLIGYTGSSYRLDLPNSFEYNGTEITSYEISAYAFYQNKNIYSIKIPASVTAIGENAFKECFHLVEIYNTSSLEITRGNSSNGYVSYYALVVNQSNTADSILIFDANEYVFAIADGVNCVIGYTGTATDLVIPGQFTYNDVIYTDLFINRYSFAYSNITSLVVSSGVKKLGQYAFAYNYSLKSVEVADTVVNFDYHPFYACYAVEYVKGSSRICAYIGNPYNYSDKNYSYNDYLTTVIITKGNSIDSYAFCKNTSLKTIVIPVTVTGIGTYSGNTFYNVTLEKIFYGGTRSQFYNIQGIYYSGNDTAITNATKYFYSEETPTDTENNYWHWVDDVPTPW